MGRICGSVVVISMLAIPALAQSPQTSAPPTTQRLPYGLSISLDNAKAVMSAAEAEAKRNSWNVVITILDSGGHLVLSQRIDGAPIASVGIAEGKARTAVEFKRPTKDLDDLIAQGGGALRLLALRSATPLEGGLPIIVDEKVIGSIGVSGALASQDAQIARVGAGAAK